LLRNSWRLSIIVTGRIVTFGLLAVLVWPNLQPGCKLKSRSHFNIFCFLAAIAAKKIFGRFPTFQHHQEVGIVSRAISMSSDFWSPWRPRKSSAACQLSSITRKARARENFSMILTERHFRNLPRKMGRLCRRGRVFGLSYTCRA
jgi:hypothetical protein